MNALLINLNLCSSLGDSDDQPGSGKFASKLSLTLDQPQVLHEGKGPYPTQVEIISAEDLI